MRIVHLCRLFTPHIGGVEAHVEQVARLQQQQGNQVIVVTTQHADTLPLTEQRGDGIEVLRLPAEFAERKHATWRWILAHTAEFNQADCIQVHDIFWWLLPIYWQNRTKIITTFHGWETQWPIPWTAKLQRRVYSWLSSGVVHVGDWISQFYGDTPDKVIYGGVEERFLAIPAPKLLRRNQPLRVTFIGRLEPDTAVPQYIELIAVLRQAGMIVNCTWVGDGSLRQQCASVGTVAGWQTDTLKWLRVSDIICASSYLSMLQAQAAGRLVISLYTNQLKKMYLESYIGSQYCIISNSAAVAAKRVVSLLEQPEALRELQQGAKSVAATLTWQHIGEMYQQLFRQKVVGADATNR